MKEINLRNISIKKKKMLWIKFADDIYIVLVVKTLKKIVDIKKYD